MRIYVFVCSYVCMYACVREKEIKTERDRQIGRQAE